MNSFKAWRSAIIAAPFGNQARISSDNGQTWSEPVMISDDAISADVGYPSTVELADGSLVTVWYETLKSSPKAVLRQANRRLGSASLLQDRTAGGDRRFPATPSTDCVRISASKQGSARP
jgi:hypothetical protein